MPIERVAVIFDDQVRPDSTGVYCLRALRKLVQVEHFRPQDLPTIPRQGFDLYFWVHDGLEYALPDDLHPLAGWLIDTHLQLEWCAERARGLDFAFAAQRDGALELQRRGISTATHLPLACDPEMHRKHDVAKEFDFCFVGNMFRGPREDLVNLLRQTFASHFVGRAFFEEMAEVYSRSRLVFNRSIRNDVNMRVVEALGCGSLLLTNDLRENGQDELFRDGIHLATYRDWEELRDKAQFYLREEKVREEIAERGRQEALAHHTYEHRMRRALEIAEAGLSRTVVPAGAEIHHEEENSAKDPRTFRVDLAEHVPATAERVLVVGSDAKSVEQLTAKLKERQNLQVAALVHDRNGSGNPGAPGLPPQCVDLDRIELLSEPLSFDAALIDDVLERLRDPLAFLRKVSRLLRPGAEFTLRVRNVRQHQLLRALIEGHWHSAIDTQEPTAFTLADIEQLCFRADLQPTEVGMLPGPGHDAWLAAGRPNALSMGGLSIDGFSPEEAQQFYCSGFVVRGKAVPAADYGITSIIIVTCNQLGFTRRCVESIRRFTDELYELIFVDNGSDRETLEYLRALAPGAGLSDRCVRVEVISNPTNTGFPAAANQGIRAATGKQVLLLNNDTVVTTGWLARMLAAMHRDERIGLVGPVSNCVSGPQQIAVTYDHPALIDGFAWRWRQSQGDVIVETSRLVGFCLLIRREVIDKIGLLDEQFGIGCFEDDDYCRRAIESGYVAVIARDAFVHHFGGMTFRNSDIDYAANMARNHQLYTNKWPVAEWRSEVGDQKSEDGQRPSSALVPFSHSPFLPRRRSEGRPLISCCMIVRNNAKYIAECILSIWPWVDEIVVVDTGSDDDTIAICRRLGCRVECMKWPESFSAARNESLKYATGKYIFWFDSDDVMPAECGRRMRELLEQDHPADVYGFTVKVLWPVPGEEGQWLATEVDHVKIFLNRDEHRFEGRIHEQILGSLQRYGGRVVFTDLYVIHKNHDHSPEGQRRKMERDLHLLHLEEQDRPNHPFVAFNLGMTYANKAGRPDLAANGDYERAKHYLRRSIELAGESDSHVPKSYSLWIGCHQRQGEAQQAWYQCSKALARYPLDEELRWRKAMLCRDRGGAYLQEAADILLDILERPGPRHFTSGDSGLRSFGTRDALARVHAEMGQWHEAEKQWRLAVAQMPAFIPGWLGLAEALRRQQKWDEAEPVAHDIMKNPRLVGVGLMLLGDTMFGRGRFDEARRAWQKILDLQPNHPEALERLRSLEVTQQQWDQRRAEAQRKAA